MISIVVCSVNPKLLAQFRENIQRTIGVAFELIVIDNSANRYGICEAYNIGGAKAQFPVICFIHEDVLFSTINWGQKILGHLSDEQTGLIGLAGGDARPAIPASWSSCLDSNEINIIQHFKKKSRVPERILVTDGPSGSRSRPVVGLDGVFLATRRDIFSLFKFDQQLLTGFHGYDIDYSMQVGRHYDLKVIFDIEVHHLSEGSLDKAWMTSQVQVFNKWKSVLPVFTRPPTARGRQQHHWKSLQVYLEHLLTLRYPIPFIWQQFLQYAFTPFFNFRRFGSLGKYLIAEHFKRPGVTKTASRQIGANQ